MSDPCFFIDMKKILCLVMAAVLAVVMMRPLEASAAANVNVTATEGVPEIISQVTTEDGNYTLTTTRVRIPIDFVFYTGESEWYMGHWIGQSTVNLSVIALYGIDYATFCRWQLVNIDLPDGFNALVLDGSYGTADIDEDGQFVHMDSSVLIKFPSDFLAPASDLYFRVYLEYVLVTQGGFFDYSFSPSIISVTSDQVYCQNNSWDNGIDRIASYFQTQWNNMQIWTNDILSGMSGFKDTMVNKFDTLFTFGRQWTDDIIDAIVGQSGGGSIGTAQDELDNQLNSIENVEQQLSDKVLDKVEVPSISLSSDETSGLNWVVSTINSLYVAFDELHVMFACVVFFSICAVLLFGRRNL